MTKSGLGLSPDLLPVQAPPLGEQSLECTLQGLVVLSDATQGNPTPEPPSQLIRISISP